MRDAPWKKINLLVLTSSFPKTKDDWSGTFILNLYKYLPKNKYNITVLAPHAPNSKRHESICGIEVIRFPYFFPYRLELLTSSGHGILHNSGRSILVKIQIVLFVFMELLFSFYLLKKKKIDIIHAHWILPQGFIASICRILFKKKLVITVHGTDVFSLRKFDVFKAFALKHCNICTVNSKATFTAVSKLDPNVKIIKIPMGVDLKLFSECKQSEKGKNIKILSVGRLIGVKGFHILIEAMPKILSSFPKTELVIVGSGPEEDRLQNDAKKAGLEQGKNFFMVGAKNHRELSEIYKSATICVVPSVTDTITKEKEGQNLIVIEALACGIPVVASRNGGISDIVKDDKTALLVKEGDSSELAQKIIYLLSNHEKQTLLAKNGIEMIMREYSWTSIAQRFDNIYATIFA